MRVTAVICNVMIGVEEHERVEDAVIEERNSKSDRCQEQRIKVQLSAPEKK